MSKSESKKIQWLTALYIFFIFSFTTIARNISSFLRDHYALSNTVTLSFIAAFLFIGIYLYFHFNRPDFVALFSLLTLLVILGYLLIKIPTPEEKFHFIEFGFLATMLRSSCSKNLHIKTQYLLAIAVTAVIGSCDEVLQFFLPRRFFDVRDIALNAIAGILAISCYEIIHNHLNIFRKKT